MRRTDRLNIAFLTLNDPLDKRSWSGTTYYIGQTLQKNIGDVQFLGPVIFPKFLDLLLRAQAKVFRILFKKEFNSRYSFIANWYASFLLKKRMKGHAFDLIVAPAASTVLAYLNTSVPIIYISDTTYQLISKYYVKEFKDILPFSDWAGQHFEKLSLKKSEVFIYSSHWAANSAINDYKIPKERVFIMPLGANMDDSPAPELVFTKENNGQLTLLFLAVDWDRKGGSIAFKALQHLHEKGIPAKLIVCGCTPPAEVQHDYMEVIPFLDKNKPADHQKFVSLLSSKSHFLILPTRADCSLLVACEANAYGVPAITTLTGGVPDIVRNGINGYCLPYEADGDEYANLIAEIYGDKSRYQQLVNSSRKRYEDHLNWDKWAEGFDEIYQKQIKK